MQILIGKYRHYSVPRAKTARTNVLAAFALGIDVSKGKSTVAVRRLGGEVELKSFQVDHDIAGLSSLIKTLCGVGWNIRVVMEHLGMYAPSLLR